MKIDAIRVDGFGVWSDLTLDGLSEGLNVFCGPNEAGKTTLMQFLRSMLYGFTPRRRRYLPPLRGGRPGGALELLGPGGRFLLRRHDDAPGADGQAPALLTAPDGTRHGEPSLQALLAGVDEPIYQNVFAVGLRELQEFGTLGDSEAATLLFDLSVGLDRVSLVEVMRELAASRLRLLRGDGKPCLVWQLLEQRARLVGELEELDGLLDQYARQVEARDRIDRETARLEEERLALEQDARRLEIAVSLRPKWQERESLSAEISAAGSVNPVPSGAIERLERINAALARHRRRARRAARRRHQALAEAAELPVNESLWRQAARIEAQREQEGWIASLKRRITELEGAVRETREQLAQQRRQLGLGGVASPADLSLPQRRQTERLRQPARELRRARAAMAEARSVADSAAQSARALAEELQAALASRGERDLAAAIDRSGDLVARLRRRQQLAERCDQMRRHEGDLQQQGRRLLERQILPLWVLVGLGLVFVLGVVTLMAGLLMPESVTGSLGWALALTGLGGAVVAGGSKVAIERSNARQLEACQRQTHMLQLQIQQANQEREQLDAALGPPGERPADRLAAAEASLAGLESLVPLRTRHEAAARQAEAAAARLAGAEQDATAAHRRWREALQSAALPGDLSPKQVRALGRRAGRLAELVARLGRDEDELRQRQAEWDALGDRLVHVATDAGVSVTSGNPIELLRRLADEVRQQQSRRDTRERLREQARRLRRRRAEHEAALRQARRQRRRLLAHAGAADEDDLRRRADQSTRIESLRLKRDAIGAEIRAALAGRATEESLAAILAGATDADLEARWVDAERRLSAIAQRLKEQFEDRGRLDEQLKTLAADRRGALKRIELATVQKQLDEAIRRWQVLAVTDRVLQSVKEVYERERQPEVLREASGYLRRLTNGRYRRVWTPLGEDVLRVDDSRGQVLPVELLSRGTREQLFLALRLALVSAYSRRGASLPVVLDDVLVNYDTPRAKAAAAVLCDFARAGHQLLVFTCHEHIVNLFRAQKIDVRLLPDGAEPASADHRASPARPGRKRRRKRPDPPVEAPDAEGPNADNLGPDGPGDVEAA